MFPSLRRYRSWALPTKWAYWSAKLGLILSIASLFLSMVAIYRSADVQDERRRAIFRAAQELRRNDEWLTAVAAAAYRERPLPPGKVRTTETLALVGHLHDRVVRHSYGEERYIYQEVLRLEDLGAGLGSPNSVDDVRAFNSRSNYTLHDVVFLNRFLRWYLEPLAEDELKDKEFYSIAVPSEDGFEIAGARLLTMKYFRVDGAPMDELGDYLGLID